MGTSRSLIFIPGNNQRFLEKSKTVGSDIFCFDLEDSVPFEEKETARNLVSKTINDISKSDGSHGKVVVSVRINAPDSELSANDLKKVILDGIDAIVIPKVETDSQIVRISNIIRTLEKENGIPNDFIKLIPSIESALGVVNAYSIAKSDPRVSSLVFGIFDFLHDMKIDSTDDEVLTGYLYGRAKVPVDARAAGVGSIDSIWQNINDMDGLERDLVFGKKLGYTGKCVIHPSQINLAHKVFAPSLQDIQWAKKVVAVLDESRTDKTKGTAAATTKMGAVNLEGKMIDAVHYKQAKRILESVNS
ncbi:MAG: CoA ester lyase [Nitrosopumilus sp.]|nr:CoA ester lyase [Nitrosopumilus sp.]